MVEYDNGLAFEDNEHWASRTLYERMEDAINALKEKGFNLLVEGRCSDCLLAMGMEDCNEEAYIYLAKLE